MKRLAKRSLLFKLIRLLRSCRKKKKRQRAEVPENIYQDLICAPGHKSGFMLILALVIEMASREAI